MKTHEILLIFLLVIVSTLFGAVMQKTYTNSQRVAEITRVRIAQDNTITYVKLTPEQVKTLRVGDSIWVDTDRHIISDTADVSFKAIIQ